MKLRLRRWIGAGVVWWAAVGGGWAAEPGTLQLTPPVWTEAGIVLGWTEPAPGQCYVVQRSLAVAPRLWITPFDNHPLPLDEMEWTDVLPPLEGRAFYRVLAVPPVNRGELVRAQKRRSLSAFEINLLLRLIGVDWQAEYGVEVWELTYRTVTPHGMPTVATGVAVLPIDPGEPVPLVSYQHGTVVEKNAAPSGQDLEGWAVGLAFGSTGYAAAMPDFLGLGGGEGLHPYQHARSEATACVDMLRACRALAAQEQLPLSDQLFLLGYSQGGHATLALQRELETFHVTEFTVTACAPMAGAYDMSGVMFNDFLSGREVPNPYHYGYLLAAYQAVYGLTNTLGSYLRPPYDTTLPPMFDGLHSAAEINNAMPADPSQVLKPEVLAALRADPLHPLRQALRDNDLLDWTPRAPVRLFHCSGDQDVLYANSVAALESFQARGADVELINPLPGASHSACALPSMLAARAWFELLRR